MEVEPGILFQSQSDSIKTTGKAVKKVGSARFNPSLIRLKRKALGPGFFLVIPFQSQSDSIKT